MADPIHPLRPGLYSETHPDHAVERIDPDRVAAVLDGAAARAVERSATFGMVVRIPHADHIELALFEACHDAVEGNYATEFTGIDDNGCAWAVTLVRDGGAR